MVTQWGQHKLVQGAMDTLYKIEKGSSGAPAIRIQRTSKKR